MSRKQIERKFNNSAGRILTFLNKIQTVATQNTLLNQLWSEVFDCDSEDNLTLTDCLYKLRKEFDIFTHKAQTSGLKSAEMFWEDIEIVSGLFTEDLTLSTNEVLEDHLDQAVLSALKYFGNELPQEGDIDPSDIQDMLQIVDFLQDKIEAEELLDDLKDWVWDLTHTIHVSLEDYRFHGASKMDEALTYCLGVILRHRQELKTHQHHEIESINFIDYIRKMFCVFAGMVSKVREDDPKYQTLVQQVDDFLDQISDSLDQTYEASSNQAEFAEI